MLGFQPDEMYLSLSKHDDLKMCDSGRDTLATVSSHDSDDNFTNYGSSSSSIEEFDMESKSSISF